MRHIDLRNILVDCQHNFCRNVPAKRSCRSKRMTLLQSWAHSQADVAMLDFEKGFDKVLSSQDAQRVVVDLYTSSEAAVLSGVPQGTMLVPAVLFPMTSFRNHLHQFVYLLTTAWYTMRFVPNLTAALFRMTWITSYSEVKPGVWNK